MKLSNFLVVIFLFLGLLTAILAALLFYYSMGSFVEEHFNDHILAVGSARVDQVESFFRELLSSVEIAATHSELTKDELNEIVGIGLGIKGFYTIAPNGTLLRSAGEVVIPKNILESDQFLKGKNGTILIREYSNDGKFVSNMFVASPHAKGVWVAVVNLSSLEKIIRDRTGLGETGEILLIVPSKSGSGTGVHVFRRLFEVNAVEDSSEFSGLHNPMKYALQGNSTLFKGTFDYRGIEVIALSYYIPSIDMSLVTEIDRAELVGVFRRQLLSDLLIIVFAVVLFSLVLAFFVSRNISKPIVKISQDVEEITKGKFDIKLQNSNILEIQKLTDSLNRILASLKLAILKTGLTKKELGLQEALKAKEEAEKRYKVLYETSSDAIMTLEPPTWKFTAGNPATVKMFGCKDENQFITLGPWELSPKYQADGELSEVKAKKMIEKAMRTGSNYFEWTHRKYKGDSFPATVLLTRLTFEDKKFLQATVRDISKEKKARRAIEKKTEELERFAVLVTGREEKMIQLKKEIAELEAKIRNKGGKK